MRIRSTVVRASAMALVTLAVGLFVAPSANAAAFRYWTYWQGSGSSWAFATQGPATTIPADGTVEGWRFAVTTQAGTGQDTPRVAPDFAAICGATAAADGMKRVGLVIDSGPTTIAPEGQIPPALVTECVVVAKDATGATVLQTIAPVHAEGGLICSLAGFPKGECAPILGDAEAQRVAQATAASPEAVASADATTAAAPAAPVDSGSPWATIAVAVVLLVGAALGSIAYRRRATEDHHG